MVRAFYGGIAYYNPKSQSFRQIFSEDKSRTDVRSFHEDKQGNIWVGTSEGVYLIDCDSKTIKAHYNLENNLARCVLKDSEDQVWVGFSEEAWASMTPNSKMYPALQRPGQIPFKHHQCSLRRQQKSGCG